MGLPDCFAVMSEVETVLSTDAGANEARHLLAAGADLAAFADAFAKHAPPEQAERLRAEIAELPSNTVMMIVQAWLLAESAGKPLTLRSVRPERPVEAARARRVELSIAMEETGVSVSLSHIPGRHATWYQPTVAVA